MRLPNDTEHDVKLAALYRAAGDEQPPPVLDDAIRAAAHRAVASRPRLAGSPFIRSWRVPLSVAAVVVLSVSVVTLMREESPEMADTPGVDTSAPRSTAQSGRSTEDYAATVAGELAPAERKSQGLGLKPPQPSSSSAIGIRREADSVSSVAKLRKEATAAERLDADVSPVLPGKKVIPEAFPGTTGMRDNQPAASAEQPRQAVKEDARRDSAASGPQRSSAVPPAPLEAKAQAGSEAGSSLREPERMRAPVSPAAKPATPSIAKPLPQSAPQIAGAVQAYAGLPPEKWLAYIEELRRQGRLEEAKVSLAEFRKSYPNYPLPAGLKDGIQP